MNTKPCPHQGEQASWMSNPAWVNNAFSVAEGRPCVMCGEILAYDKEGGGIYTHPQSGEIPDYGNPEAVPAGATLARYDNMACNCGKIFIAAFTIGGKLLAAKELPGRFHKQGRFSYTELSVVAPADAVLLCVTRSTHSFADGNRYLKLGEKRAELGKLGELAELPDAAWFARQLGVEITPEVLERIFLFNSSFSVRKRWAELKAIVSIKTFA